MEDITKPCVAVFIHGVFSNRVAWDAILPYLENEAALNQHYDFKTYNYPSPKFQINPSKAIPDYDDLAASLGTFIETACDQYQRIAFVTHSQGGLILQRYLADMIRDARGLDLRRVRTVVHLACPHQGSSILLTLRRVILFKNRQVRSLQPIEKHVTRALATIYKNIVFTQKTSEHSCPIPHYVYAGETDRVVPFASAVDKFPHVGSLPGDHKTIIRPRSSDDRTVDMLKMRLLQAVTEKIPEVVENQTSSWIPTSGGSIQAEIPIDISEGEVQGKLLIKKIQHHAGSVAARNESKDIPGPSGPRQPSNNHDSLKSQGGDSL